MVLAQKGEKCFWIVEEFDELSPYFDCCACNKFILSFNEKRKCVFFYISVYCYSLAFCNVVNVMLLGKVT